MTPDKEALIHAIELRENIAKRDHHGFVDFTYEMVGDVLALLKKKETQKYLVDESGKITPLPVVVRCKDCKWWDKKDDANYGYCHACKHGYYSDHWEIGIYRTYKGDWFCADGERK